MHRYQKIKSQKPFKAPTTLQITMVSARAQEYITRFSGKGARDALEKIVEYREECKGLYHEADAKKPMNYKAAEDKKEYLSDMIKRIECLAEARDYLQNEVKKAPAKANNMHSAVAFVPEKTKPAKKTKPRERYYDNDEHVYMYDNDGNYTRHW